MARNNYIETRPLAKPIATYNNILIICYVTKYLNAWGDVIKMIEHYTLCNDDGTKKPWLRAENRLNTYYKTIEKAKEGIDNYLNGSIVLYTDAQYNKYISNYNRKYSWGFNKQRLLTTMRMHKKGDKIMKALMEDRLEDANFHEYCGALAEGDYDKFMDFLKKEYG